MPDWFTSNAPAAAPQTDWFAANAPGVAPAAPEKPKTVRWHGPQGATFDVPTNSLTYKLGEVFSDVLTGAAKSVAEAPATVARVVHAIPGVSKAIDTMYGRPGLSAAADKVTADTLKATNTAQSVGKAAEQVAEAVYTGGPLRKAGTAAVERVASKLAPAVGGRAAAVLPRMAVEAAGSGAMAAVHGGNPVVGAAFGAAGPALGAAVDAVPAKLKESAAKGVTQALGPTKERFKAMAERLTPEILRRGLRGSRESIQAKAAETAETVGEQIDSAIQAWGDRPVFTHTVLDHLENAKQAFRTTRTMTPDEALRGGFFDPRTMSLRKGARMTDDGMLEVDIDFEPRAIKQIEGLQKILIDMGDQVRVDQLVAIRRAWDKVVDQAGGFAHRAQGGIGMPLKDTTEAWAKREATGAIRKLLNAEVPELADLNKEYSFWKGLDDVLTQTLKRTQPHGPSLKGEVAEAAYAAAGSGHGIGAALALKKVGKMAHMVFSSPRWKLASAQMKDALAEAIAGNDVNKIATALSRIGAVQGAQIGAR